jgi:hypothetical protein
MVVVSSGRIPTLSLPLTFLHAFPLICNIDSLPKANNHQTSQLQCYLLKEDTKVQQDQTKAFAGRIGPDNIAKWNATVVAPDNVCRMIT